MKLKSVFPLPPPFFLFLGYIFSQVKRTVCYSDEKSNFSFSAATLITFLILAPWAQSKLILLLRLLAWQVGRKYKSSLQRVCAFLKQWLMTIYQLQDQLLVGKLIESPVTPRLYFPDFKNWLPSPAQCIFKWSRFKLVLDFFFFNHKDWVLGKIITRVTPA